MSAGELGYRLDQAGRIREVREQRESDARIGAVAAAATGRLARAVGSWRGLVGRIRPAGHATPGRDDYGLVGGPR